MDIRDIQLARTLVHYSCRLQPGERVLIEANGLNGLPLVEQIIKEVYRASAIPFVNVIPEKVQRELLLHTTEAQLKLMARFEVARMSEMQAYIGIGGRANQSELSDIPSENLQLYNKFYNKPVNLDLRVPKTKWVVLRYPSPSMAQASEMSTETYEEFFYNVCNLDYAKMSKAMDSLVAKMEQTDRVRITGPGTDLSFSIKGIPVIKCAGECNIPDGEVYTAPVKNSVNGILRYNTPSEYQGFTYENIELTFKDGKIINAVSNDTQRINQIFEIDEGARYVGEFAIGVNPYIEKPAKNTLFDEKIKGSFHFTPGCCYDDASNGNKSAIHWDLVCIQTQAYGGGEVYFDDVLIRKDGIFVIPELFCLNPESLI